MSAEDQIVTAIQQAAGTFNRDIVSIVLCNVDSISDDGFTCDCTPIGGNADTQIPEVKLNAEANDGFLITPTIDSTILVASSTRNNYYVLMYSDIQKVTCVIDNDNSFEFSSAGFIWNGGSLGGLTKTLELKAQLDKLNAQLQAVITSLTSWSPVANDGGAALKTYFATQIAGKPAGSFTNIEDTKIKH